MATLASRGWLASFQNRAEDCELTAEESGPQSFLPNRASSTTIVKGTTETRGDLKQLAATLNNPLKRSPGAYAWAFFLSLRRAGALCRETQLMSRLGLSDIAPGI
jgi:hypothetical protein